jgi:LysR family glycine cleavage system transcriptional activator
VYDAAARHLSFTRAADELAVTPAAVGQHIRALEDMLGVVLFRRTPKGLELTHEGEAGLDALRNGFLQFEDAVRAMQAGQSSQMLTIAAPRDFTSIWLMPRLAAYAKANSEVRFHLISHEGTVDFTEANLDLAVVYAEEPGEHEGVALADGVLVRVGSGAPITWTGGPDADDAVLHVSDTGLAIAAAANGIGQAHVPALLADGGDPQNSAKTYWLIAPLPQWRQRKVKSLVAALTDT